MKKRTALLFGLGAVALVGLAYMGKAKRASDSLESSIRAYVPENGLSGEGLRIGLDVTLTNPTNGKLRVKHPYIKLAFSGTKIGESAISNSDINIPANSTVRLAEQLGRDIEVFVPLQSVLATMGGAVGALLSGAKDSLALEVTTKTTAFAPGIPTGIPYEDVSTIPLKAATA